MSGAKTTRAATSGTAEKQNDAGSNPTGKQELAEIFTAIRAATEEAARELKALRTATEARAGELKALRTATETNGRELKAIRLLLESGAAHQRQSTRSARPPAGHDQDDQGQESKEDEEVDQGEEAQASQSTPTAYDQYRTAQREHPPGAILFVANQGERKEDHPDPRASLRQRQGAEQ